MSPLSQSGGDRTANRGVVLLDEVDAGPAPQGLLEEGGGDAFPLPIRSNPHVHVPVALKAGDEWRADEDPDDAAIKRLVLQRIDRHLGKSRGCSTAR